MRWQLFVAKISKFIGMAFWCTHWFFHLFNLSDRSLFGRLHQAFVVFWENSQISSASCSQLLYNVNHERLYDYIINIMTSLGIQVFWRYSTWELALGSGAQLESPRTIRGPKMITRLCRPDKLPPWQTLWILQYIPILINPIISYNILYIKWFCLLNQQCVKSWPTCHFSPANRPGKLPSWREPSRPARRCRSIGATAQRAATRSALRGATSRRPLSRLIHIDDDELLYAPQHRKIGVRWLFEIKIFKRNLQYDSIVSCKLYHFVS